MPDLLFLLCDVSVPLSVFVKACNRDNPKAMLSCCSYLLGHAMPCLGATLAWLAGELLGRCTLLGKKVAALLGWAAAGRGEPVAGGRQMAAKGCKSPGARINFGACPPGEAHKTWLRVLWSL